MKYRRRWRGKISDLLCHRRALTSVSPFFALQPLTRIDRLIRIKKRKRIPEESHEEREKEKEKESGKERERLWRFWLILLIVSVDMGSFHRRSSDHSFVILQPRWKSSFWHLARVANRSTPIIPSLSIPLILIYRHLTTDSLIYDRLLFAHRIIVYQFVIEINVMKHGHFRPNYFMPN